MSGTRWRSVLIGLGVGFFVGCGADGEASEKNELCRLNCEQNVRGNCPGDLSANECVQGCQFNLTETPNCEAALKATLDCKSTLPDSEFTCDATFDESVAVACAAPEDSYQACITGVDFGDPGNADGAGSGGGGQGGGAGSPVPGASKNAVCNASCEHPPANLCPGDNVVECTERCDDFFASEPGCTAEIEAMRRCVSTLPADGFLCQPGGGPSGPKLEFCQAERDATFACVVGP